MIEDEKHIARLPSTDKAYFMREVYAQSGRKYSVRKSLVVVIHLAKREVHFEVIVNYGEPSIHLTLDDAIAEYNKH